MTNGQQRVVCFLMASQSNDGCFVSILIPAYNEEKFIERAIVSVKAALEALNETSCELIVCDNNSSDATARLAAEAGAKVVFEPHNQIARARNAAAAAATGRWLIFMDADSELSEELLKATLDAMRHGTIGAGGALVEFDRPDLDWHVRSGLAFWNALSRTMQWAAGSYIFCRRDAWREVEGFDEEWYAAEELIFSRRLKKWCRANRMRFKILTDVRLRTSARKIDRFTIGQTVRLLAGLAWPGALKRREKCGYWYKRSS